MSEPFAMLPESLLFSPSVSAHAKVLFGILQRHGPHGIFPSRARLASLLGASLSTVDRALRELTVLGLVEREARYAGDGGQTSNLYRVVTGDEGGSSRVTRGVVTGDEGGVVTGDDPLTRVTMNESKRTRVASTQLAFDEFAMRRQRFIDAGHTYGQALLLAKREYTEEQRASSA